MSIQTLPTWVANLFNTVAKKTNTDAQEAQNAIQKIKKKDDFLSIPKMFGLTLDLSNLSRNPSVRLFVVNVVNIQISWLLRKSFTLQSMLLWSAFTLATTHVQGILIVF
jgi:hypothetical protein